MNDSLATGRHLDLATVAGGDVPQAGATAAAIRVAAADCVAGVDVGLLGEMNLLMEAFPPAFLQSSLFAIRVANGPRSVEIH
jgi:hypothetical protein